MCLTLKDKYPVVYRRQARILRILPGVPESKGNRRKHRLLIPNSVIGQLMQHPLRLTMSALSLVRSCISWALPAAL